ncbi:MAG: DUF2334 domain-containing protein [Gammaproteobacteria bacterium]|nr:DUF2334 domain-containing protein [Gammaproteobacteria bacterium]
MIERQAGVLLSIHDVMPESLDRVEALLQLLPQTPLPPVMLLAVPGRPWAQADLARLRSWLERGCQLAGHGWHHHASVIRGFRHRLHAALISKDVAEHLALSEAEIVDLLQASYRWFHQHDLPSPSLYVPPAWALGRISRRALALAPYRYYESLAGLYDSEMEHFQPLPLVGYEAPDRWQAVALTAWNGLNRGLGCWLSPLRLSIHPGDLEFWLGNSLRRRLSDLPDVVSYPA